MSNPLFTFTEDERAYLREGLAAQDALLSPYAARDEAATYERPHHHDAGDDALVRPAFTRDVDIILNNPYYNRCMDKTQVFPLFRNDDLTRRSFHLQLVAQISRKIASALRLNVALTEAIALGHDLGHTPFGHGGERLLSDLYHAHTGRYFNHNVHSVRLLRTVSGSNLSLQTLNGMLCHCGEKSFERYEPAACDTFEQLDAMMETCYTTPGASQLLRPSTLEGCVVRICDILAYLGKDRQDAMTVGVLDTQSYLLKDNVLGAKNSDFIQNATANIIKNSINQPYLKMDAEVHAALDAAKAQNYAEIYNSPAAHERLDAAIPHMMEALYDRCLADLAAGDETSYIFRHHINAWMIRGRESYTAEEPNDIVVDYLACMTDEYFINLFNTLFPKEATPEDTLYVPYFH